jgi:hypothetical protein
MSKTVEVNFSDLIQKPKDTVAKLSEPRGRRLLVRRRDDEDLVLTTASRAEQDLEFASATTRMFVALMSHDDGVRTLVTEVMPEAFPWVRFLPTEDVRAFVVELVETMKAAEGLDNPAPVIQVITEWRHTAEVHADPELLAILRQPAKDHGPVPAPTA